MWQRNGWILALGFIAACLDDVSSPAGHTHQPLAALPRSEHLWVFHIAGGPYADHIQLVAIGDQPDAGGLRVFRPIWSRAWDGSPVNDFEDLQATALEPPGQRWEESTRLKSHGEPSDGSTLIDSVQPATAVDTTAWTWTLQSTRNGETLELTYRLIADTAFGMLTLADGTSYPMFGVRFDSAAENLIAPPLPAATQDSQPVVLIRLDDASATDRDFLQRLSARGLTAELAVPTRFLGGEGKLTWQDVRDWRSVGIGVVMHSRYHLSTNADAQHFIGETVGGFLEMAAHGFASHIFVQPGTWRDSIYFDSPAKLHTWRGALLRTFATVSECYAYRSSLLAPADSFRLGISHSTISDGVSNAWISSTWQKALRARYATVFLVHTYRLKTPDQLDWFLDLVADAKARGVVRVVANSEELFESP